jgi:uncharacterized protein (DUF2141 family)
MRIIALCLFTLIMPAIASAHVKVSIKIHGVKKDGGKIYLSIFNSEPAYKAKEAYKSFVLIAENNLVTKEIQLPDGHYVFSIYQDSNGNEKLDTNLVGIPKEKFGFTNYDGKSAPGGFNRHKVKINMSCNEVVVALFKI